MTTKTTGSPDGVDGVPRCRDTRRLLHDEARGDGHGTVDQPVDHRGAWRTAVGGVERATRVHLPVFLADRFLTEVLPEFPVDALEKLGRGGSRQNSTPSPPRSRCRVPDVDLALRKRDLDLRLG